VSPAIVAIVLVCRWFWCW